MKSALILLAEGAEEMEAVIIADILRRAECEVVLAGVQPGIVTCSRGIRIMPDLSWESCDAGQFDGIIIPGGLGGAERLAADERVLNAVRHYDSEGKIVAAICAGPTVLAAAGILKGRRATIYPGLEKVSFDIDWVDERVVVDGHIVTSQGPGTAMEFALQLVALGHGQDLASRISKRLLMPAIGGEL